MVFVKLGWLFRAVGTIGAVGVTVIDKGITYFNFLFKFFYYVMLIAYRRRCANIQCTVCTVFWFFFFAVSHPVLYDSNVINLLKKT